MLVLVADIERCVKTLDKLIINLIIGAGILLGATWAILEFCEWIN